jgi:hypothetical protein
MENFGWNVTLGRPLGNVGYFVGSAWRQLAASVGDRNRERRERRRSNRYCDHQRCGYGAF